ELLERSELLDGQLGIVRELLEVAHVDVQLEALLVRHVGLDPEVTLRAGDGVFLAVIHSDESAANTRSFGYRYKPSGPTNEVRARREVQNHVALRHLLRLRQVLPQDRFPV